MDSKRFAAALTAALCAICAVSCSSKGGSVSDSSEPAVTVTAATEEITTEPVSESSGKDSADINDYVTIKEPTPAMWKVTDKETGNALYMLGTMHIVTNDTYPLPDYIMDVYKDCDGIAIEYDVNQLSDLATLQEYYSRLVYIDGTDITNHLSKEAYERSKKFMGENLFYNETMDGYTAGFWATQIESTAIMKIGNVNTEGVDYRFMALATEDGKDIVSIETAKDQADVMNAFSDDLADYIIIELMDGVEDMEAYAESFASQYDLWASGNIDALDEATAIYGLPKELQDDYTYYLNQVIFERNEQMADKAVEYMKNGNNYFFMVGAAHFAGSKGVDDILAERGYKVERVA